MLSLLWEEVTDREMSLAHSMETPTMFSLLTLLASIPDSQHDQAIRDRHCTRPDHRRSPLSWTRFRLEGLEERCLMSGISGYTEYAISTTSAGAKELVAGPDGNFWFLENLANKIGMINPTTHAMSEFPAPTAGSTFWGITAGSDGNIWFTERGASKIGMINPTSHVITEFATSNKSGSLTLTGPEGITAGPDGNVWFTENTDGQIGWINPTTKTNTVYPVPANGVPKLQQRAHRGVLDSDHRDQ
jgi:hypothetical protein